MDEEVKGEGNVPTGDVQLAVNQALINVLDPVIDRATAEHQLDKIRQVKELMG